MINHATSALIRYGNQFSIHTRFVLDTNHKGNYIWPILDELYWILFDFFAANKRMQVNVTSQ